MKKIVVFCGTMGVGKDTSANILARMTGGARLAYADPLKDAAEILLGIPKSVTYGTQEDKANYMVYGKSARHWLQWIGTEVGRQQIHKDVWVHRFADRALAAQQDVVICSDGRFKNEIVTLREHLVGRAEVSAVRVKNPRAPVNLEHVSESEIYNLPDSFFDFVLLNDSTMEDLTARVAHLAKMMGLVLNECSL